MLDAKIKKKCQFLKWPPHSILQISPARFHQIVKNWIFLKSARKGQLKNVQDGISRPLGSREIQKTKVETVLWDTLYVFEIPEQLLDSILLDCIYRVSHNTVSTFVFWISRLPRGLEIQSWPFSNSPFRADFKNIHFFII